MMKSINPAMIFVILASVILLGGCITATGSAANVGGNTAPDFTLVDLEGKEVSLTDLKGEAVILNFWASWCPACREEMPYLQSIHETYSGSGLNVITINIGEDQKTARNFLSFNNLSLTVWMDRDKEVARKYNIAAIPTTYFIDEEGIIVERVVGAFPSEEAIVRIIEEHFKR